MFCLDYAVSFCTFACLRSAARDAGHEILGSPTSVLAGSLSGLVAACALWPFDLVRQIALSNTAKSSFATSSVPFSACYLGGYFLLWHDDASLATKLGVATAATSLALVAEFPLDHSKHAIAGTRTAAALFSAIRLPFAALLLVAFDATLATKEAPS